MEEGDYLVANSDGLTNMISNSEIVGTLIGPGTPDEKSRELVNLANNRGGLDNITVALVHVESEDF